MKDYILLSQWINNNYYISLELVKLIYHDFILEYNYSFKIKNNILILMDLEESNEIIDNYTYLEFLNFIINKN